MGIPKFFRWISERYPKINQRYGSPPNPETVERHFDDPTLDPKYFANFPPDPLSQCMLPPEIDRLYIDMNGILHGCSHNNAQTEADDDTRDEFADENSKLTVAEIFRNVEYYLDRIVTDVAKPKELVYMAIDGVAPRAKLNQQRSRRYRSGQEGEIEQTIYEAHAAAVRLQRSKELGASANDMHVEDVILGGAPTAMHQEDGSLQVQEVQQGRFAGTMEAHSARPRSKPRHGIHKYEDDDDDDWMDQPFHSHLITPGTAFMEEVSLRIQDFVKKKLVEDPAWQHLTIIFDGPDVPGEGEHKIMDFIRHQKSVADPNTRHCIMGQDGDLIILGLVAHEPNLVLLREKVDLGEGAATRSGTGVNGYIHNPNFEFLHLNILRDYLAFDLETSDVVSSSRFDLEHTLDDFCFMTFLIGNDFLPHLPALDIGDEALELLFEFYQKQRSSWLQGKQPPYLTYKGNIVSGLRLEKFLSAIGAHEMSYYDNKKRGEVRSNESMKKTYKKLGLNDNVFPSQDVLEHKEEADRAKYREMMESMTSGTSATAAQSNGFQPVMSSSSSLVPMPSVEFEPADPEQQPQSEAFFSRLSNLLHISLDPSTQTSTGQSSTNSLEDTTSFNDQDLKGRYYYDKFGITPFDYKSHMALRKAYVEGLVWNLKYYYEGCVSWEWHYPYHYGPMISDLTDLDELLDEISFEGKMGQPLKPFEQLLACLPASSAFQLPKPYRWLMTDPTSPIIDFYPKTYKVDMNGKRWPWEAVTLLPLVDKERLLQAVAKVDLNRLSDVERRRNQTGNVYVVEAKKDAESPAPTSISIERFDYSEWKYDSNTKPVFEPRLTPGVTVPLPGFASLKSGPIKRLQKARSGINVFNSRSRYTTVFLVTTDDIPPFPLDAIAKVMIESTVYINFPFFTEAVVTAVSDATVEYRGTDKPRVWNEIQASHWLKGYKVLHERCAMGEGLPGTGGWILPPTNKAIKVSVRPQKGFKTLTDGTVAKTFERFEVELPLICALWSAERPDPRISGLPLYLEKDPFRMPLLQWQSREPLDSVSQVDLLPTKEKQRAESASSATDATSFLLGFADKMRSNSLEDTSSLQHSYVVGMSERSAPNGFLPPFGNGRNGEPPESISVSELENESPSPKPDASSDQDAMASQFGVLPPYANKTDDDSNEGNVEMFPLPKFGSAFTVDNEDSGPLLGESAINSEFLRDINSLAKKKIPAGTRSRTSRLKRKVPMPTAKRSYSTIRFPVASCPRGPVHNKLAFLGLAVAAAATIGAKLVQGAHPMDFGGTFYTGGMIADRAYPLGFHGNDIDMFGNHPSMVENQDVSSSSYGKINTPGAPALDVAHGTTTLSFIFKGGIIAAVDSRATIGNFVGSKTTQKVLPVNSHVLATMAGGAADCSYWIRKLRAEAWHYELTFGLRMSVARVSRLLSNYLYANRSLQLSVGTMVMGIDNDGLAKIYYVNDSGLRIEGTHFAVGSGSTFALGILDTTELFDLEEGEAISLGIKAIRHATFRDANSGGFINVYLITKDGYKKVFSEDLARLQHQQS